MFVLICIIYFDVYYMSTYMDAWSYTRIPLCFHVYICIYTSNCIHVHIPIHSPRVGSISMLGDLGREGKEQIRPQMVAERLSTGLFKLWPGI